MNDTKPCPYCGEEILAVAKKCKHCKEFLNDAAAAEKATAAEPPAAVAVTDKPKNFAPVIGMIHRREPARVNYHPWQPLGMFALANLAICLSVTVVTLGNVRLAFVAVLLGMFSPIAALLLSKFMAKRAFDIKVIDPGRFRDDRERQLYHLIKTLAERAGLPEVPEVGLYKSPEMNAFATGTGRRNAMVAFSSALVDRMDEDALAAVAAHEIAHIANGDMLTMTLLQSVVNTVVVLIDLALYWFLHDRRDGFLITLIKSLARWAVVGVLLFLGNLLMLWFSRHREFKADRLAAELVKADAMVKALDTLRADEDLELPDDVAQQQEAYAAFKIASPPAIIDLFSTHPSLERRIARLQALNNQSTPVTEGVTV